MAEVQALFGDVVPGQDTVPAIEVILERALEAARRGEMRCIALAWIDVGDGIHRDWCKGDKYNSQLAGVISELQYSFMKAWDEA